MSGTRRLTGVRRFDNPSYIVVLCVVAADQSINGRIILPLELVRMCIRDGVAEWYLKCIRVSMSLRRV